MNRTADPSAVRAEEGAFVAPYLTVMDEEAPQRTDDLRAVCTALRWLVPTGAHGRMLPHDLSPWPAVDPQLRRWWAAGVVAALGQDLRGLLRLATGRAPAPRAASVDSRTLHATPER